MRVFVAKHGLLHITTTHIKINYFTISATNSEAVLSMIRFCVVEGEGAEEEGKLH